MEQIIRLSIDSGCVVVDEDVTSALKQLFSGCRVNFLLGAGFSANILGTLNNSEIVFEGLDTYQPKDEIEHKKVAILSAFMYWIFFNRCIVPIKDQVSIYDPAFKPYYDFGQIMYRIFSERGNPALDRQFNIFTTNYDPIIELIFDQSNCICNDGFEGRIIPRFSTDNFSKSFYRQAIFSNRKAEIPSVNLIKLHGSLTWENDIIEGGIVYQDYNSAINGFLDKYNPLFDDTIVTRIDSFFTADDIGTALEQIAALLSTDLFNPLLTDYEKYEAFISSYSSSFLIVNPTKKKFGSTLQNKNYYELLRIFSNELEKENSLLVVNGFSFRDEHILDLIKRSMINPALKILIFCYREASIEQYRELLGTPKNNNISYICLNGEKLSLELYNQILSHIHA